MSFNFDEVIDRVGTHSSKWDTMEGNMVSRQKMVLRCGSDMDFRAPQVVQDALAGALKHGVHGYFGDDGEYRAAGFMDEKAPSVDVQPGLDCQCDWSWQRT